MVRLFWKLAPFFQSDDNLWTGNCSRSVSRIHNLETTKWHYLRWPKSVMAISTCSRQFQFAHGNFNLFMVISICSQQFQFSHAISIFSRQRSRHFSLRSPPVNFGVRQWPPKVKTQNRKSIFKVDLQSEK